MATRTEPATERTLGIVLVSSSAAVFGLTGVLTKSIHADPLTITCWRGFVGSILISLYVFWRRRGTGGSLRLGWRGWLLAVEGAAASIAFISAFKFTFVANVAVIYATAPFIAALLGWLLTRERFRTQTMLAAAVSMCGVAIMVWSGVGTGNLFGDGLALLMTVGSALYMIMVRAFRDTPVVWAGAVSAFLLFLPFHASYAEVIVNMVIVGLGSGALVAALPAAAASAAPATQTGVATGLTNSVKTVGGAIASCVFGIALLHGATGAAAEGTAGSFAGYVTVWLVCGLTAFASAVLLLFVPKDAFSDRAVAAAETQPAAR